tara:strand:+ start:9466 stop:10170 length:705 start_codon:yes stop_codon:yes gene_type:complete
MSLEQLFHLCGQDARIYELNLEIARIRKAMEDQIAEIKSMKARVEQFSDKEKQFEIKLRATEVEVQAAEQELKRLQAQRMQVSSQKILSGLDQKIEAQSGLISELEEKWFEDQEALEVSQENLIKMRGHLESEQLKQEKVIETGNSKLDGLEQEFKHLMDLRSSNLDGLQATFLKRYEFQRSKNSTGRILFDICENNCSRCGMQIPSRTFEMVRYNGEVASCSSCDALLFYSGK